MMMIAFITINSGLVHLIQGLFAQILYFRSEIIGGLRTYMHVNICIYTSVCIDTRIYKHVYIYVCVYICIYIYTNMYIYVRTYKYLPSGPKLDPSEGCFGCHKNAFSRKNAFS